ncbi:class I SAM-dependent methyltransferase [Streptomyces sp. NPDC005963]|uniref:class I SAM-dependent methyltransferase n=1 Tax=Streptomyces sp. NPDC005963 TaxID=3156721 RepID=UPI0033CF66CB
MSVDPKDDQRSVTEFFSSRAADWDARFPDDGPAYAAAVASLELPPGGTVLDAGCGTGRALPALRSAVGLGGTVVGADLTPAMLAQATAQGRTEHGSLLLADVSRLPLADISLDAVFAAGLISHLHHPGSALRELARVVRSGGRLALFHPVGRAALASRQGRQLADDDLRAEPRLDALLTGSGWTMTSYEDRDQRFLVLAVRKAEQTDK